MAKKRIVMALGHNALGTNLPEQKEAVTETAKVIADFIQAGWQVALTHSNAPQVGMIHTAMNEFGKQHDGYTSAPMSVCSAMSQGYIGYDLQNGIRAELVKRGIYKPVATILTQMMVDPYDDSFYTPMKPVGRFMTAGEAKEQGYNLKGASAVIEKDRAAGLLAKEIDADVLMILTSVDNVTINYGTPDERPISHMSIEEAESYINEGQFEFASMLPKIEASVDFVTHGKGRSAIITSLSKAKASLAGKAGTTIE